jgi:two-component system OmpR family sensor kinase
VIGGGDIAQADALLAIAALQQEVARLREAVQARDEFISIAAHELRSPLTPLLMTVQSMRRTIERQAGERQEGTPAPIAAGLARLDRVVQHYVRRCDAMLDISRLSSGTFRIEWAEADLAVLLRGVIEGLAPYAERAGSSIELAAPDTLAGTYDELAVQQIAENLVSNAVKYGGKKPISVSLRREQDAVALDVRDQGIGISAADQARIFSPFERAVSRRQQPGFGLGLWVVGRLAAAMGGTVQVSSDLGQGSIFSVRLPHRPSTRPG